MYERSWLMTPAPRTKTVLKGLGPICVHKNQSIKSHKKSRGWRRNSAISKMKWLHIFLFPRGPTNNLEIQYLFAAFIFSPSLRMPHNHFPSDHLSSTDQSIMAQNQPSSLLFECARASDGAVDAEALLHCFANRLEALEVASSKYTADTSQWLLIFAGALVFIMQAGFAVSESGVGQCRSMKYDVKSYAFCILSEFHQAHHTSIFRFALLRWCARGASGRRIFKIQCWKTFWMFVALL